MSLTKSTQTTNNTHKCTRQAYHIQCFCLHVTEKQAHKQQTTHFNAQDTHTTYSAFNYMSLTKSTQTTNNTHKCTRHAYHIQCFQGNCQQARKWYAGGRHLYHVPGHRDQLSPGGVFRILLNEVGGTFLHQRRAIVLEVYHRP